MSCEDQAITGMLKSCIKWPCCSTPEKAILYENEKGFMICPLCKCSYGVYEKFNEKDTCPECGRKGKDRIEECYFFEQI